MDEHRQKVHAIFSRIAGNYDRMNSVLSLNLDQYWRKKALDMAAPCNGETWLDICCGTGKLTLGLRERMGELGQVCGLDFNDAMLEIAKRSSQGQMIDGEITWMQADAMNLPFAEQCFDGVTIGFGLRNLPDYDAALAEIHRVLKPGGRLVCLDLSRPVLPLVRQGHGLFVRHAVPWLARLNKSAQDDYQWLPDSLAKFPEADELAALFLRQGFSQVGFSRISAGIVCIHTGIK